MKIKPIIKGLSHTGVAINVMDKNIELSRHKLNRFQRSKTQKNSKVNHFHLDTPMAKAVLKTAWDRQIREDDLEDRLKVEKRKKGISVGKLSVDWDFEKLKKS